MTTEEPKPFNVFTLPLLAYKEANGSLVPLMHKLVDALRETYPKSGDFTLSVATAGWPFWEVKSAHDDEVLIRVSVVDSPQERVASILRQLSSNELHDKLGVYQRELDVSKGLSTLFPRATIDFVAPPIGPFPEDAEKSKLNPTLLINEEQEKQTCLLPSAIGTIDWIVHCSKNKHMQSPKDHAIGHVILNNNFKIRLDVVRCYGVNTWMCTLQLVSADGVPVQANNINGIQVKRIPIKIENVPHLSNVIREISEKVTK